MRPLAKLTDVGKRYVKYEDVPTLVTGVRHMLKRGRRGRLWAVRHVNLEIGAGEAIGILGRNGSGKSTTLSMMAGVTAPTEGVVTVNGRIAPLLRLGVGFDAELTGRENVYINGMILGLSTKEIEQRFDDIVEFAELERFINTPVKFYSSGMLVRLGFASAVASQPDLLIIDEVLSVGDVAFQVKSFDRMIEMRESGATLVVVSHNFGAIRRLTEHALVLNEGDVRFEGPTGDAISTYHEFVKESVALEGPEQVQGSDVVKILSFDMLGEDGLATSNVQTGEPVTLVLRVRFEQAVEHAVFGMSIATETGQWVYAENSSESDARSYPAGDERTFSITLPMRLVSGSYVAAVGVRWGEVFKHQILSPRRPFYVSGRHLVRGVVDLEATFVEERAHRTDQPDGTEAERSVVPAEPRDRA